MEERGRVIRNEVAAEISRRQFLKGAGGLGLSAMVLSAAPLAQRLAAPAEALAAPGYVDATLQAFFDTIIPGRKVALTELGNPIHPKAIAGVDPEPGAVETDALALARHPKVGFNALAAAFIGDLNLRSLLRGGDFLNLDYERRQRVCISGLAYGNALRLVWEAAAAIPFVAFCAAAMHREPSSEDAAGYRLMGFPGVAPHGYPDFSYGLALGSERTADGNLP
jgi:TAT (twin-arginine translocation) pathway signal sequence